MEAHDAGGTDQQELLQQVRRTPFTVVTHLCYRGEKRKMNRIIPDDVMMILINTYAEMDMIDDVMMILLGK